MSTPTPNPYLHFLATFLVGGTSAACALTVTAPLERIKLLLQTQKGARNIPKDQEYKGIIDCFVRIPKEQGLLAFWRGNLAGIYRVFPHQAMNFSFKELFKEKFITPSENLWARLGGNVLSGGVAGAAALTVIYPLDYARTRMAIDIGARENRSYSSVSQCLGEAFRHNGIRSIYRGYVFAVMGAFIYRCLYFGLYDTIMECVRPEYAHKLWVEFPVAEFSCTTAGFISYPLDTVRRRMMLQNFNDAEPLEKGHKMVKYKNTMDCCRTIWRKEGVRGFFHGGLTNMYRGTGGAIMLVMYDKIQYWLFSEQEFLSKYVNLGQPHREEDAEFRFSLFNKPCKIFKDRCVFCNF